MTVATRDATSGRWIPQSGAEWASLLAGTGIATPTSVWLCQESSGTSLADTIGSQPLAFTGADVTLAAAVSGWSSKGAIHTGSDTNAIANTSGPIGELSTTSSLIVVYVAMPATLSGPGNILNLGTSLSLYVNPVGGHINIGVYDQDAAAIAWSGSTSAHYESGVHPIVMEYDATTQVLRVVTDLEASGDVSIPAVLSTHMLSLGYNNSGAGAKTATFIYGAGWSSVPAELATSNLQILVDRLWNGPQITSIAVTPASADLETVGATASFTATTTRIDGSSDTATPVVWSSLDKGVATITSGTATAVASGAAQIVACAGSLGSLGVGGFAEVIVVTPAPAPNPVPLPVVGTDVPDLVAEALSRLLQQDKGKPRLAALVTALVAPFQDVVNASWQLATQRSIYNAVGQQLDDLGALLDVPRSGLGDDDYREALFTQISILRSSGTTEDLLTIAKLALNDPDAVIVSTSAGATADAFAEIRITNITLDDATGTRLFGFLARGIKGGVGLILRWSNETAANTFTLDIGPGLDTGHLASAMEA